MIEKLDFIQHDMSSDLSEKFDALFPTWPTVVATIIAFLIVMLFLTKLVYKPVKKMVDERKSYIQTNIDVAVEQNKQASLDREIANDELIQARIKAAEIITAAKIEAEQVKAESIADAKDQAHKMIKSAQIELVREKDKFEAESKQAIVEVALAAAAKIVEKEVDTKVNRKIVEDFILGE